jgi:O-antigen ligase
MSGGVDLNNSGIQTVINYAYWLLVFVIIIFIASQGNLLSKVTQLLGWGVFALALLRWGEVLILGNIGAWTGTHTFTQNEYGMLFSTNSPFLLMLFFRTRGNRKVLAAIGNILLWCAAIINGSRSSWVAIAAGLGVMMVFLFISRQINITTLFVFPLVISLGVAIIVNIPTLNQAFVSRFNTFGNLNNDKSYAIRLLMNQKSLKLFESSPIFGVGSSRFRNESAILVIPEVLSYGSQEYFNAKTSHNSYLSFLAENGLGASLPYFLLLGILLINGIVPLLKLLKKNQIWPLAIYLSFLQMSIHMWSMAALSNTATWFVYGLMGAMLMAVKQAKGGSVN